MFKYIKSTFKNTLTGILLPFFFIGCFSQPLTTNVINEIGFTDIDRFQYYTSERIRLTATERIRDQNVDRSGTAIIRESAYRDIIVIGRNTMGVLMDSRVDENGLLILEICFEENALDSDKRIIFKQDGSGLEHHFFITYSDARRRLIQYGDREFAVGTNNGRRAYLKIKVNKSEIEKERIRRVRGRRVGS